MLERFLNHDLCLEIVNESYNYVMINNHCNITLTDFKRIANQLLPNEFRDEIILTSIYHSLTNAKIENELKKRVSKLLI